MHIPVKMMEIYANPIEGGIYKTIAEYDIPA